MNAREVDDFRHTVEVRLRRLEFAPDELFACELTPHGPVIPGRVNGEETWLLLSLLQDEPCVLDLAFADRRGLLGSRERRLSAIGGRPPHEAAIAVAASVEALGVSVQNRDIDAVDVVLGRASFDGRVAGATGGGLFAGGVLALAPDAGLCAFTRRPIPDASGAAEHRVPLLQGPTGATCCTSAILDGYRFEGEPAPTLLLEPGIVGSRLTLDYVHRRYRRSLFRWAITWAARCRRTMSWKFVLPDGWSVRERVGFVSLVTRDVAAGWGREHVDGVLGMGFLRRWLCLFDLQHGELLLFPLSR